MPFGKVINSITQGLELNKNKLANLSDFLIAINNKKSKNITLDDFFGARRTTSIMASEYEDLDAEFQSKYQKEITAAVKNYKTFQQKIVEHGVHLSLTNSKKAKENTGLFIAFMFDQLGEKLWSNLEGGLDEAAFKVLRLWGDYQKECELLARRNNKNIDLSGILKYPITSDKTASNREYRMYLKTNKGSKRNEKTKRY
jgi:hypothetical protein